MSRDFQAFHKTFFDESRQLLAAARSIAADGAHASLGAAQLAELHRCVHGVAGGAATLGFDQPASLARAVEACLERFRARASSPDAATLGCCRAALDL
ncbi:MAG TPA: Hpt domain-containing protein, partial [Rhodocyclaceae bacterium]|nr:Hpt domain-containing protein [Rhodocyclaceae bacterium]